MNASKSGISASIGGHGATLNLNRRGRMGTVGLPGSGISYRSSRVPWGSGRRSSAGPVMAIIILAIVAAVIVAVQ